MRLYAIIQLRYLSPRILTLVPIYHPACVPPRQRGLKKMQRPRDTRVRQRGQKKLQRPRDTRVRQRGLKGFFYRMSLPRRKGLFQQSISLCVGKKVIQAVFHRGVEVIAAEAVTRSLDQMELRVREQR